MEKHSKQELWKGNAIARFFLWCSGARIYLLKRCPTEINMFMGIGIVVFLTGIMASISGGYAFHMVFDSTPLAIVFGLFWGILIFFLDWYLVSSLKKEKKWWKEFSMAFPRIVLAVFIAVVVARPVEMKLFEKEIDLQVQKNQLDKRENQNQQIATQFGEVDQLKSRNDSLEKYLMSKAKRRDMLYNLMIAEAEGRSPVGIMGKGPVYKEKRREYDIAQKELEDERARLAPVISSNLDRINQLNVKKDELLATNQIVITRANGFLSRMRALHQLQKEDQMVGWASLFILLLFIAIEISPVFVKLISSRGPYDELLQAEQYAASYNAAMLVDEFSHNRTLAQKDLIRKEELLLDQNELVLSNAYKELTLAKQEINKDRIKRWKELQLKKNGETINKEFPLLLDMNSRPELSSSTDDQSTLSS
ncbi:MAG: DUF4407 domain-containing protein [Salinivirgaceae bacterium]|nr:MAG: DUF4407 domain-containing protein [Salinivirgaceae bacterium]